tara:strand:- start:451 stop:1032 length:582 start_codon:yes stop_codon:yes gene_type:complete
MSTFEPHKNHVIVHALLITVLPFSPIPLLDWFLEPVVARRMFAPFMKYPEQRRHFIGKGGSFCLGCITSLLLYPLTKLFRILRFFLNFKGFIKTFYYWLYKSYVLHEAQTILTESTLSDHKQMFRLGKDLDSWLRTSEDIPSLGTSQLSNLQAMRTLFQEVSNGGLNSFDVLKDTEALHTWIKIWAAEHDTPE